MQVKDMIERLTDTSFVHHPAWPSFVREMKPCDYGEDALKQAWYFYKAGWAACDNKGPEA